MKAIRFEDAGGLTLGKFAVLGAVFLSGAAIAANADPLRPANPGAVGTVANAAASSQSPGREVAALPPANTAAPNSVTLPEVSIFGVVMHPYTSHLGPKASPNGTLTMDHHPVPPAYETASRPYTSHLGPKVSSNGALRAEHYQLPPDYAKDVAMHPYSSHRAMPEFG
jgi:hypothetical protein